MRYGTVVQYFPDKGFGFIRPDTGPDIFFHVTALGACQEKPEIKPGQPVKYQLAPPDRPSGEEPRSKSDQSAAKGKRPGRRQAELVELIDRMPGASLEESADKSFPPRHRRARGKKPTWRR